MNSLYFKTLGQPEYREDYAQLQNDQSFEDLQDKFQQNALFKLKKEHHLNTINIPEAAPTVQDIRPSVRKYTRKHSTEREQGIETPLKNRRKDKIEYKKEEQEVVHDPNPIEIVDASSGKRGKRMRSTSPSAINKRQSKR